MDRTPIQWAIEPLRRYAQFGGRARRAEYWWFVLFAVIVSLGVSLIENLLFGPAQVTVQHSVVNGIPVTFTQTGTRWLSTVLSLALLCPQLAVGVRRLHDIDRSGWWLVLPLSLVIATILAVAARFQPELGGAQGLATVLAGICGVSAIGVGILLFVWACRRGTVGPNRFGSDPLAFDEGEVTLA